MITVFTPTYNRGYILPKLYESLCNQTCKDFEWIVVDDGSTDNTLSLLTQWKNEGLLNMTFTSQKNGGKHRAINLGVKEAVGDLFFIVDSDDHLSQDAIEWLANNWEEIRDDSRFAGVSGTRAYPDGRRIGGEIPGFSVIDTDPFSIRTKFKIPGDLAEAWRTEVLRKNPFPDIKDEKFCSEGLIWSKISRNHIVRFINKPIYVCDYLQDGLTKNSITCRLKSPYYSMISYKEFATNPHTTLRDKIKYYINYWLYSPSEERIISRARSIGLLGTFFMVPGFILKKHYTQKFKNQLEK